MPIRRTSNKSSYDSGFYNPEVYSDVGSRRIFQFDSDALNYINAVEAADTQALEFNVKLAYNAFVLGCKADGIWTAIKASCILAGARTLDGALVPLVGTAPTNNGPFVSGDYNRETGLVGDGSTKYLTVVTSTPLQNSAHQSVHLTSGATTVSPDFETHIAQWPASGTDGRTQISTNTTDTFVRMRSNTGSNLGSTSSNFIGINRSASASYTRRAGGSTVTVTQASTGAPSTTAYVFCNPSVLQLSNARIAFYSIGESLDLALLDTRVSQLITDIGNAIP